MIVRALLGLGAGAVLGGIAGWAAAQADPLPPPPVPPHVPCEERLQQATVEAEQLQRELSTLETRIGRARRARAAVRGMQRDWPDQPPDILTPQAIEAHIEAALEDSPGTLEELDCEAYPCVAVLSWETPPEELDLVDAGDGEANLSGNLLARLSEGPYGSLPFWHTGRFVGEGLDESVHAFTWLDPVDYSSAKEEDPGQAAVDGTVVDAAHGRAQEVLETWLDTNVGATP